MKREPLWRRYDRFFGVDRRADADDELAFHYEMRVRDYMNRGMDEAAARQAAGERLGNVAQVRQECATQGDTYTKQDRRREWFGEIVQDVRYGARVLRRAPVFAAVAVLTLALGIGATTAIFSIVHRVLLAPLPYADASRLVTLYERAPQGRNDANPVSSGNYSDWAQRARSFSAIGAFSDPTGVAFTSESEPVQIISESMTPSAYATLGPVPQIGRTFTAADADAGGVLILSDGFWRRRFGADTAVLRRKLTIDGADFAVVGVFPASFAFPSSGVDVWRPIRTASMDATQRRSHNFGVVARLAPGVTAAQAQSEMSGIAHAIAAEHPEYMTGWDVSVRNLHDDFVEGTQPLLLILFGAVGVVLLIACGNLANLLLARAVSREREFVLRGALGAGRARLVRQLLTESLLIAVTGGALGVLAAAGSVRTLLALAPPIPLADQTHVDSVVVAFAAGLTLLSTLLFGLAPAVRLARTDLQRTLRTTGDGGSGHVRLRGFLLVTQIALSVVLLVSAGLLVRSFERLHSVDLGIRTDGLAVMSIDLPRARYQSIPQQLQFYDALTERLAHVPGVRAVAGTSVTPARGAPSTWSFAIEGRPSANASGREDPQPAHFITANYTSALGIRLISGRTFDAHDRADAPPVVLINEALRNLHWRSEDPVGKRISLVGAQGPWLEIVGVIGNTRTAGLDAAAGPAMYIPFAQKTLGWLSWMGVLIRSDAETDPASLLPAVRAALWELDPQLPVLHFDRVNDLYRNTIARRSFAMALVTAFGVLALALCIIGLYGLMSYTVAQQRREIGVRMALGASSSGVIRGVLSRSMRLAGLGIVVGLVASVAATRLLGSLLFGVSPLDTITFAATAAMVFVVATGAAWVPALRAARTPPLEALRG